MSGCNFNCKGCFNKDLQDFSHGLKWTQTVEDSFIECLQHPQVKHANLLGGEIMQQDSETILYLVKRIKSETSVSIWCWTGELYQNLINKKDKLEILKYIDILIDGQFEIDKKDLKLKYKGSSNQRIIDVQESLKQNEIILKQI